MATATIKETGDYDQFQLLDTNREQARGHIELLKQAFAERGNLTQVLPIVVNEKMQVIDGQHRLTACRELGETVYYTVVPGLRIDDARNMNILHKGWGVDDFAKSYAASGNMNYQKYLDLKEDFGFSHAILLRYIFHNTDEKTIFKDFREGNFVFNDPEGTVERLSKLADMREFVPFAGSRAFARAVLRTLKIEGYDHKRMLRKLQLHESMLHRFVLTEDYLRMLEDIYNHQMQEDNRLRLF